MGWEPWLAAVGGGSAAGQRAALSLLLLTVGVHLGWLEHSEEQAWVVSPVVISVLAALAVAEWWMDRSASAGAFADVGLALPRWVAGACAGALAVGGSEATPGWAGALAGLLSAVMAERGHVHARTATRELAEGGTLLPDRWARRLEVLGVVALIAAALLAPLMVLLVIVALVAGLAGVMRMARHVRSKAARWVGLESVE